ncbi:MAG: hypothetical protein ABI373_08520, partial [Flavobacteriales bacterium]
YADNSVSTNTYYEYKVVRSGNGNGTGYIASGINLAPVEHRGTIILLVDNTLTSGLTSELLQLQADLKEDGWVVSRHDVSPSTTVTAVKSTIVTDYSADPTEVKALYIIGHVAVPYSGKLNPDGHSEHMGAWPSDGYYGDMDGTWTDQTVNATGATDPRDHNVPGDGKFDQSDFPSAVELQVGRVDFNNMSAFSQGTLELTRAYLNKAHAYKTMQLVPQRRGVVFDNFLWINSPLAGSGYRNVSALVGGGQLTDLYPYAYPFSSSIDGQSYLWTYFSGGGTFTSADNVGTTQDFSGISFGGIFNMSFGSFFGDWDSDNNFLKATIASGNGLTNVWCGIPNWFFQNMGMGDNIGYSTWLTMNNTALYTPQSGGWQGSSYDRVHLGLMGDPSLRMTVVSQPSNVQVVNSGGIASFSWTASSSSVDGYYVYEVNQSTGGLLRLNNTPVVQPNFSSAAIPFVAGKHYMVRAVKLQVTNTGSFNDLSLGAEGVSSGTAVTDCLGVVGGSAQPGTSCNDGNASTINDVYGTDCTCSGTAVTLDCQGVPNGTALPGSACNDNNPNTGNDHWNSNCVCVGQTLDCICVPGGSATPGTSCDDGNASTINDVYG